MSDLGVEKVVGADAAGLMAEQVLFPRSSSEADVVLSCCCIPSGFTWVLTLGAMLPWRSSEICRLCLHSGGGGD
jgi:hypothetical protein